jgi:KDO2-lipid IV(A) lauroyltransferase
LPPGAKRTVSGTRRAGAWSLDGPRLRTLAKVGASRGPGWFVRVAPPVIGLVAFALATTRRRAIAESQHRVRGSRGVVKDTLDVARTFVTYAECLTEGLRGPSHGSEIEAIVRGAEHLEDALAAGKGLVLVTAHTAGWELAGRLLLRDLGLRVMIVVRREDDAEASAIQDDARRAQGLIVAHAGDDPLSALPLLKHLREGGIVALQIDRVPGGMRSRPVQLFGKAGRIPEGPLRLAAASGAPVLAVFSARTGHGRYEVVVRQPVWLERGAGEGEIDAAAQKVADGFTEFVRGRPTQWFHFGDR